MKNNYKYLPVLKHWNVFLSRMPKELQQQASSEKRKMVRGKKRVLKESKHKKLDQLKPEATQLRVQSYTAF